MSTIVTFFLHPMPWFGIGFFILWWNRKKWNRLTIKRMLYVLFLLMYFFATPLFSRLLVQKLEDKYPPIDLNALPKGQAYHIIALGAGQGYDDRLPANALLSSTTLIRLVEAIRIYRQLPNSMLVTSANSSINRKPQAIVAKEAAISLGVPEDKIFPIITALNTQQEAEGYVKALGKETTVIVVTSAIHMPRAMEWFRRSGAKPLAAPTDYLIKKQNDVSWKVFLPNANFYKEWQNALKEQIGLWYFNFLSDK